MHLMQHYLTVCFRNAQERRVNMRLMQHYLTVCFRNAQERRVNMHLMQHYLKKNIKVFVSK